MAAYDSHGTLLKIGSTTIGQLLSLRGPSGQKEVLPTTHLSTTNKNATFISSIRDEGEVEAEVLFDPVEASHEAVEDAYNADTATTWSIVFSDAAPTTWSFSAITITPPVPSAGVGQPLQATFRLKVTAGVTRD